MTLRLVLHEAVTVPESVPLDGEEIVVEKSPGDGVSGEVLTGFPYRLPRMVEAIVSRGDQELARSSLVVAQLGRLLQLPSGFGGLESRYRLAYDPRTGSLRQVSVSSSGLDREDIEKIADVVVPLLESSEDIQEGIDRIEREIDRLTD